MNKHIFQSYIDNITQYYGISQKQLFSGGKDYESVEPRQLFYFLCHKKGIPVVTIQKFLDKKNYSIHHSNIVRGIERMNSKIEANEEYKKIIPLLEVITANVQ